MSGARRAAARKRVVDVLPFVPVTPTAQSLLNHAGGSGKYRRELPIIASQADTLAARVEVAENVPERRAGHHILATGCREPAQVLLAVGLLDIRATGNDRRAIALRGRVGARTDQRCVHAG